MIARSAQFRHSPNAQLVTSVQVHCDKSTVSSRFDPPAGFVRLHDDNGSNGPLTFVAHLQELRLKPCDAPVLHYDGTIKSAWVHEAVIDLPIGKRDLHQCADAVMRLWAEYLYAAGRADEIGFHFTNGFYADFATWAKGNRIKVEGNKVKWMPGGAPGAGKETFWKYLETLFAYAGTLSLSKELHPTSWANLKCGDVLIHGGSPGHAVIVIDCAVNPTTRQKCFMLAQSYMPAQELHILKSPNYPSSSPWYLHDPTANTLDTPQWSFSTDELMSFTPIKPTFPHDVNFLIPLHFPRTECPRSLSAAETSTMCGAAFPENMASTPLSHRLDLEEAVRLRGAGKFRT
ncbi:MAG: DUF4846 domain-containing protein [Flavobacteriales bacterium]|nr:DUF4846 domain-containing protein [Flavobacteriales bacterium]